jgi:hypothetical protein
MHHLVSKVCINVLYLRFTTTIHQYHLLVLYLSILHWCLKKIPHQSSIQHGIASLTRTIFHLISVSQVEQKTIDCFSDSNKQTCYCDTFPEHKNFFWFIFKPVFVCIKTKDGPVVDNLNLSGCVSCVVWNW